MTMEGQMRHSIHVGLFSAGLLVASSLGSAGCGLFFGCDDTATCEPADTGATGTTNTEASGGPTCMGDPAAGEVMNEENEHCGIWASSSLGDDENPGTRELPVKTLARAIDLAGSEGGPGNVHACAEVYPEAVTLGGVSLFGGFRCSEPGWPYRVDDQERATVLAPPAVAALLLTASDIESRIHDLDVIASDAVTPGGSSIAVFALEGSRAFFRRSRLTAGDGADGLDGEDGSHDGQPAQNGAVGDDGMDACTADPGLGGLGVVTQCRDGAQSIGGQGGDGDAVAASDGAQGFEPPDPNQQGHGAGGKGEDAAQGTACTGGQSGAAGQNGIDGMGASAYGKLTSAGFFGAAGGDGLAGLPGQGGGGGGASLGAACAAVGGAAKGGAGGGSGGSGGCGGRAGKGGQAGGSSFALAFLSNDIYADEIVLVAGNGGDGGRGGSRQVGGKGGLPGYGGTAFGGAAGAAPGCAGGVGGYGGAGGTGGGGRGGHSASEASPLIYESHIEPVARILGQFGFGGPGGLEALNKGQNGFVGKAVTLEP